MSIIQEVPVTGAVIVSTPQHVALADVKKELQCLLWKASTSGTWFNRKIWRILHPEELPDNKYYIFGKQGAQFMAEDLGTPVWERFNQSRSIREAGDVGRPACAARRF